MGPTVQQMMQLSPNAVVNPEPIPVQSSSYIFAVSTGLEPMVQGESLPKSVLNSNASNIDRVNSTVAGLDKLRMKRGNQGTPNAGFAPSSSKKQRKQVAKQPKQRTTRHMWSDEEHTAYLKFVRYKAVDGRLDERILTDIPTRTLAQIRQYNYKHVTYRNNGIDVVDDAFKRNPHVIGNFTKFITTICSKYCAHGKPRAAISLDLYDSTELQWNLYHSIRILESSSSLATYQVEHEPIPLFSRSILKNICLGVTEIIHKHIFQRISFQIAEFVRFLTSLRKYISDDTHIQAYDYLLEFLLHLTDNLDMTCCTGKINAEDIVALFSLCKQPSDVDQALQIATSMTPSIYVSFKRALGDTLSVSRSASNLQSCHIRIPRIPPLVYQMLCSIAAQICHEVGPEAYLYLSATFLVYLQILSGTVEEIIYEIYKHVAFRCTKEIVPEQNILVLCIITYILCSAAIHHEEHNVR